jgi:DNA repair exonuclease SbcCD ATPase subunit
MNNVASPLRSSSSEPDEERLLKLFWNRAELKKELASLRAEGDRLKEQLQQQEGATFRSQQRLEQLEGLLADPLQAANASVFYQLRGVWHSCRKKMVRMANDLLEHQESREKQRALDLLEDKHRAALDVILQHIAKAEREVNELKQEIRSMRDQHQKLGGFWNYFKRRELVSQASAHKFEVKRAEAKLERFNQARKEKESEARPDFNALSVEGKRKINLALIVIAQELYIHFEPRNISVLAREASVRQVHDATYGGIDECRELNAYIEQRLRNMPGGEDFAATLQNRTKILEESATYRRDTDTVPVAVTCSEIPAKVSGDFDTNKTRSIPVNVLAEEYWEIYTVLLT